MTLFAHSHRGARFLGFFLLAGLIGGCTRYAAPTLSVAAARVTDQSPQGVVISFDLDATNTNEVELPLREMDYTLRLDGREVFRGVRSPEASLRRLGTQRITVPAAVGLGEGQPRPAGVVPYVLEGELAYITPGQIAQVLFDIRVRRPKVAFRQEGMVDLGQALAPQPAASEPGPPPARPAAAAPSPSPGATGK
jgi:hypothetical protein